MRKGANDASEHDEETYLCSYEIHTPSSSTVVSGIGIRQARALSAGTQPGERVHPEVVQVMREEGIDLNSIKAQLLSEQLAHQATLLVTMGCGDACPYVPGLQNLDWPLQDPKGQPLERVREIRDEIRARVTELAEERKWG